MASVPLFREEDHPRANDGKFTDKARQTAIRKIEEIRRTPLPTSTSGHTITERKWNGQRFTDVQRPDKRALPKLHPAIKQMFFDHFQRMIEIERHEREQGLPPGQHGEEWRKMVQDDHIRYLQAKKQAERDIGHGSSYELLKEEESKHQDDNAQRRRLLRKQKRIERQLDEIENHLDNLQERYADREGGSITEIKFPDEEAKKEYDELDQKRIRLEKQYDELQKMLSQKKRHG